MRGADSLSIYGVGFVTMLVAGRFRRLGDLELDIVNQRVTVGGHELRLTGMEQSLPYLLLQTIPIWASFKGYGFDLGLTQAFALMVL